MTKKPGGNENGNDNGHAARVDHYATRAIHVGSEPDPSTGAVIPSMSVATTFKQNGVGKHLGHEYSRTSNPTRAALEQVLTSLETSPSTGQGESLVFASGSAATAALAGWVSLSVDEGGAGGKDGSVGGGHVLAVNDVYGGTARYLSRAARGSGLEVTYLDMEAAGEDGIRQAIRPDTRLIWLEVPTNPMLLVPPLPLIASIVDSLPPDTRPLVVVDTTFLSSFYITPLVPNTPDALPLADITLSSLSKYCGGHSDIILGSLTVSSKTLHLRPHLIKGLRFLQNSMGASTSPRDCHLLIRSLKTLGLRTLRHGLNALRIAEWLKGRKEVEGVRYPGLKSDGAFQAVEGLLSPNAKRELEYLGWEFPYKAGSSRGGGTLEHTRTLGIPFGGMVTFTLKDATVEQTDSFLTNLRLAVLAESLGGVESLIEAPYGMTHSGLPEATRQALGITPGLIRLSVGIEDVEDLIHTWRTRLATCRLMHALPSTGSNVPRQKLDL